MRKLSRLSSFPFARLFIAVVAIPVAGLVACSEPTSVSSTTPTLIEEALPIPPSVQTPLDVVAMVEEEIAIAAPSSSGPQFPNPSPVEKKSELDLLAEEALYHDVGDRRDFNAKAAELIADGRAGEAVTELRHALFDDASAPAWARLGDAYLRADDVERAAIVLGHAMRLDSKQVEPLRQLTRLNLNAGAFDVAKNNADLLVRNAPDDVSARYLAGVAYMKNAMWRQAIEQMEVVVQEEPQNIYAHNNAGFASIQVGDVQNALVHLEPIAQLADVHAYMLNNLGVAYERSGRESEAHAAFSRAVELRPGYVNGTINKERIEVGMSEESHALSAEVLIGLRTPAGAGVGERVAQEESADEVEAEANLPMD